MSITIQVAFYCSRTLVCIDQTTSSLCVPLIENLSPLAYALINEVHWYDAEAKHGGNETVLRHDQKIAYVIQGRPLKMFRNECPRCKILSKRAIGVAMGPISESNLCIAPVFPFLKLIFLDHFYHTKIKEHLSKFGW